MIKPLIRLINDIRIKFGFRVILLVLLMMLSALSEGIVMAMILPLLHLIGIGNPQDVSPLVARLKHVLSSLGINFNIQTLLTLILIIAALQGIVFVFQSWLSSRMQNKYVAIWRESLFSSYMRARWPFFVNQKSGELNNKIIGETMDSGG